MFAPERQSSIPLIPAITDEAGDYVHTTETGIDWTYAYDIHAPGTRSERRIGKLEADGLEHTLAGARPGDSVLTPWGTMQRMRDTDHERGFLLEHSLGAPPDLSEGKPQSVPQSMLARGGRWKAQVGPWSYIVHGSSMGTRSERRIGKLYYGRTELIGAKEGDYVDGPWGRLRWMGLSHPNVATDYEQGFLLRGTNDRALDHLQGSPVFPDVSGIIVRLESLYMEDGVSLEQDDRPVHTVSLMLSGRPDRAAEISGTMHLDPNTCSLNVFGDREGCTKIAVRSVPVSINLTRLADPRHTKRRFFTVRGEGLSEGLALIVQGQLERCYLKLDRQLVPLFRHGCA
jgi:hypothetical protein